MNRKEKAAGARYTLHISRAWEAMFFTQKSYLSSYSLLWVSWQWELLLSEKKNMKPQDTHENLITLSVVQYMR